MTSASGSTACRRLRREGRPLIRRLIYVAFFIEVGLLLIVLPWSGFWERNYFAAGWPGVYAVITNNFVRGAVTGLGLVNLVAGIAELASLFLSRGQPVMRDEPSMQDSSTGSAQ